MIINTSERTDTVNYYTEWLLNRFKDGFCYVKNPMYGNQITRYELNPDVVDCVLFCSKNYAPILDRFHEIYDKFHIFCYYTITAFDSDMEPNVPSIDDSIDTLIKLSKMVGSRRVAWRFDPILLTQKYTKEYLISEFEYIASKINKYIAFAEFSFIDLYDHITDRIPDLLMLTDDDKYDIAKSLSEIAKKYNIHLQTCGKAPDYSALGIGKSACVTPQILEMANPDIQFKHIKCNGIREGCGCMSRRDIGEYNTCLNGCKYCYANTKTDQILPNYKAHDKNSPILIGHVDPNAKITQAEQKSLLVTPNNQTSFFDF